VILARLRALVAAEGGLLAAALMAQPRGATPYGDLVARGPRAVGHDADLPLVAEAVREGYLLHHGASRLLKPDDPDLALLAGDQLYALGLERLAAAADLQAVAILADLIALGAQAQAAGDSDLADALWMACSTELGWGFDAGLAMAKDAARAGDSDAAVRLRAAARQVAGDLAPTH
jgi:hypothetical protein